jgi:hypothetical protein
MSDADILALRANICAIYAWCLVCGYPAIAAHG